MPVRPLRDKPSVYEHTGFILAEDEMLKAHLTGITVPGREPTDPEVEVGCWFRWPEGERQIKYPFIAIDLLSADPAFDLFHSDHLEPTEGLYRPDKSPYLPPPPGGWGVANYAVRNYLPFRLQYQVAVHTRNALHDRYLQSIFKTDVFPVRPFWLWMDVDQTWRRTELVESIASDLSETTESGTKRIFRKVYTVSVLAEVPQDRIVDSWVYKVLRVLIPVVDRDWFDSYYEEVLKGEPDPLGISQATRDAEGEYFHIWHEGHEMPAPS